MPKSSIVKGMFYILLRRQHTFKEMILLPQQ